MNDPNKFDANKLQQSQSEKYQGAAQMGQGATQVITVVTPKVVSGGVGAGK